MDTSIIAAVIGAVVGVFGTLGTIWVAKWSRKWQLHDKEIEELRMALGRIETLTTDHITAIETVVNPLVMKNDFPATYDKYHSFVNDPKFPAGYDGVKGVLHQALSSGRFRKTSVQEKLKQAIQELYDFQQIGFLLKLSSYNIADSMTHADQLLQQLKSEFYEGPSVKKLANQVMEEFLIALRCLLGRDISLADELPKQLSSEADVIRLIKVFCREWQRHAEMTLYGRRGLNHKLGEIRLELPRA